MSRKLKVVLVSLGVIVGTGMPLMAGFAASGGARIGGGSHPESIPQAVSSSATPNSAEQAVDESAPSDTSATTTPSEPTKGKNTPTKTSFKDQEKPKEFTWDGSYIGLYAGEAWANSRLNSNAGVVTPTSYFTSSADIRSVNSNSTGTVQPRTPIGGIQVGTNTQSGHLVYGGVLDYGSFNLSTSKSASRIPYPASAPATYSLKAAMSTSWLASLRARVGYAPNMKWPLFYATGGVAITNLHVYNSFTDTDAFSHGVGGATKTKVKAGWIIGAGLEYPISLNWTVDGQYQFVNFGSIAANGTVICRHHACRNKSPFSTSANLSASMVQVGVNYKLA